MEIKVISNEEFEKYLGPSPAPHGLFMTFVCGWYIGLDNFYSNNEVETFDNEEDCKSWLQCNVN